MAENFGTGVSYVDDPSGYNYDTVVFQKGKPPLDTELNLIQQVQNTQAIRRLATLPSGWLDPKPFYTSSLYKNQFYTQDPNTAIPEYALVNGSVLHVTGTGTPIANANLITLPDAPTAGAQVNGVFLEVWRALLDPDTSLNKPDPTTNINTLLDVDAVDSNNAWIVGQNGLVLHTENGGETWNIQAIDTKYDLNAVYFNNTTIGWLVGDRGTIARSSSSGKLWNLIASNTVENLNDVYAASQQVAWAVGDAGTILKTLNGINWVSMASGVTANLHSIYFVDTQNVWAVGDSGTILRTNNGGTTWTPMVSGVTTTLNSVKFFDLNTGFAVGNGGVILATQNGGASWVSQSSNISTIPPVESHVYGEDVSTQFSGSNNYCTVAHNPVTRGNGSGSVTNVVSDIQVTVNGTQVVVTSLNGTTGKITLQNNPLVSDVVKVYYWYKNPVQTAVPTSLTTDFTDLAMAPSLDDYVNGEDISSQANGTNKAFSTMNRPITRGDGNGTISNVPIDVTVTVGGVPVLVNSLDGLNGQIILDVAPKLCDSVKVYYWYKVSTTLFRGKVWITGRASALPNLPVGTKSGVVLESDDRGATWTIQDPKSGFDINAVYMADQSRGWVVGQSSFIRHTTDGGYNWFEQLPHIVAQVVQRVFPEGNVGVTSGFLPDDAIHPDTNIETTKRVQVQYRIRIVNDVDPFNFPEAGLGAQAVYGDGPVIGSGSFAFENMGTITGDYGLWRAKCSGTVDGYSYAIPMAFVARRNSASYNAATNANGSSKNTSATDTRLDLLTSDNVVSTDILDVRRQINVESTTELLSSNFEALMDNRLETRFVRNTGGGDVYGTQILQLDRVGGVPGDGGIQIGDNSLLGTVASTGLSSTVTLVSETVTAPVPATQALLSPIFIPSAGPRTDGIYHQDPAYYSALYNSNNPDKSGTSIPGTWSGLGTPQVTFTFNNANTLNEDPDLDSNGYVFSTTWVNTGAVSLNAVPSEPKLVKNYYGSDTSQSYYFQGVFETSSRIIHQWDSGIPSFTNYAIVYPQDSTSATMAGLKASPVELHYFIKADGSNSDSSSLTINRTDMQFNVETISRVKNVTVGNYYQKIRNVTTNDPLKITLEAGYDFVQGSIYEIEGMVRSVSGNTNVKNGASVNFKKAEKALGSFCVSEVLSTGRITVSNGVPVTLLLTDSISKPVGTIIGVSSVERIPVIVEDTGIILPFCWVEDAAQNKLMYPVKIFTLTSNSVKIIIYNWNGIPYVNTQPVTVSLQVLVRQNQLYYTDSASKMGLLIGYNFKPFQSVADLPTNMSIKMIESPSTVIVSDLGLGGSLFTKDPFNSPLLDIPVNDSNIPDDRYFYNIEPLAFLNFSIDGGYVQMPIFVPGNFGGTFNLTSPTKDILQRYFYSACSKEFLFRTEGLQLASPRKIFISVLGRVSDASDQRFLKGEYVMLIFSRNDFLNTANYTGYKVGEKSVIALYRLPNRPLIRI